jgi:CMP-N,N'-diacetyllegionaminic acid synthase
MKQVLAIIPARGGSKGLPGKNIKPLLQHPLIAYSIKAALESNLITRTIVSTDSEEIASIAKTYGAEVPMLRPAHLADDEATDFVVFEHLLDWLHKNENYIPEIIVQLRPTSPVRFSGWVDTAIEQLNNSSADSIRAITESPITPFKMWLLNNNTEAMDPLLTLSNVAEPYNQPRQHLPMVYWQTGTIDVIRTEVITIKKSMSGDSILPFVIDKKFAIDIDDVSSFYKAEEIIQNNNCIKFDE